MVIHATRISTAARILLALSASMTALSAHAQQAGSGAPAASEQPASEASGNNEIVVTAQFRSQRLQDTPLAITAVTAAQIEARSATNIADIANQAPSVTIRPQTPAFGPSVTATIRGLGQFDFNPAYEPGVGFYIDDVYYPRLLGANFDLMDVERVEILRGPQGTLTGRNSEGGAIKFVSRQPTGDNSGYLAATFGIRSRIGLRGSADFKIAENLFGRVSGTFSQQNGYVSQIDYGCANPTSGVPATRAAGNCTIRRFGDTGYQALRTLVRWNPSPLIDATVSGDYIRDERNQAAEVLLYGQNSNPNVLAAPGVPLDSRFVCGKFCNYSQDFQPQASWVAGLIPPLQGFPVARTDISPTSKYEGWGTAANVTITPSSVFNIKYIGAYREFRSRFDQDQDLSPANVGNGKSDLKSWFVSQELRLNFKPVSWAEGTIGGYYSDEKTTYYTQQDIRYVAAGPLPIYPLQFIGNDPVKTESKAVFGTVIVKPIERLTITGGLRYTSENKSYTFFRYNFDGRTINSFLDPIGARYGAGYVGADTLDANNNGNRTETVTALTGRTARYSGDRVDYRVSVDYRFSPQILAYSTIATGFKGGGVGPRPFNALQAVPFGPEKLTSYEIGLKTDLFDRRVRFNVSGYYQDFTDAQLVLLSCPNFGGPGPCALPQNTGNATVKGFEAELFARPVDGLQIDGSISYLDWTWDCVVPAVVVSGNTSTACSTDKTITARLATPPRGVADTQWSIGAQYEVRTGSWGTITPRIDVSYQSRIYNGTSAPVAGTPTAIYGITPAYTIANARLTWVNPRKDLSVSFEVTNLTDEYYFYSKFDLTGAGAGTITGAPARPREWAVTVKKNF